MTINFEYHDVAASEQLESFTENRMKGIIKRFDRITGIDVYFRVNDAALPKNRMKASIRIELPGETLFAESVHDNFQQSVAESIDQLKLHLRLRSKIKCTRISKMNICQSIFIIIS